MLSFRRVALALVVAGMAAAQPALTTIQDILYRADGTRFNGTVFIVWDAFQAGDASNIATANLTVPIINGVLKVQLVPTTTASAGAQYNVTFNSQGRNQFTQVWAVPTSSVVLRMRDVLVSQGWNLNDCSGPCGGGGGISPLFSDGETPGGAINGTNAAFTLAFAPSPAVSLDLYRNGLRLKQSLDYSISGSAVTFLTGAIPQTGDLLTANYRYGDPGNPLGSLTPAQVICSAAGASTSASTLTQLGSCTIPAGLLGNGDRIEVQFHYNHAGSSTGFTAQVQWAGATVISRSSAASETSLVGRTTFGVYAGAQSWDAESWGSSLSLAVVTGTATVDTTQSLKIAFQGQMAGSTTDRVILRNFTVTRYPAQASP